MLGEAIKEVREEKGITQQDLGQMSFLSYKTISAMETGRRRITKENAKNICEKLGDPKVYMEAVNEICGGVFSVPWLNGNAVDLHRSSVKEKVIEELDEAINAINLIKTYKNPNSCTSTDKEVVAKSIQETIDVYVASAIYIAVMCREYSIDIKKMFQIQKDKLIKRGYLKANK